MMGLYHRILRQLRADLLRYLSLFFLIVLCMYVVVSVVGVADTVIKTVEDGAVRNNREDGQFTVFTPLSTSRLEELTKTGVLIEAMFYLDFKQKDGSIMRVFQNREDINLTQVETGALPQNNDELLVEKLYAEAHGISVGSSVAIGGERFTVSGIGTSPDYDSLFQNLTDVASDKERFSTAFVSEQAYQMLRAGGRSVQSETYLYAYKLNDKSTHEELKHTLKSFSIDRDAVTDPYFLELIEKAEAPKNELLDGIASLMGDRVSLREVGELVEGIFAYNIENLTSFVKAKNNLRIAASTDDVVINKSGGILAGIIALILFAYVISVFIVHSIDSDSEVIGTLYALGVSQGVLLRHYLALPTIIAVLGGICGTLLGFSPVGVVYQMQDTASYFSYPAPEAYYPVYLLAYGLVMPPLVALIINWLVIRSRLTKPPLALLKKEIAKAKAGGVHLGDIGFVSLFRLRQILREKRASLTVCGGMFIALLLLFLGVNCYSFITAMQRQNDADIQYEYMVSLKYPPKQIPEGATEVYMYSLTKEIYGSALDVSILGIDADNPYFDFSPAKGEETLTISGSMANKYHLNTGDTVILSDSIEDRRYVFTVDAVVPYSVGLYAFMDIESARSLFNADENAYNVLLSDAMPDVEAGRIHSVIRKVDILAYSDIFMTLMTSMIVMMVTVATVVFIIVMYLMMKMMIDRSVFGISLMKIFGFNDGEIRKLYLDGNFITVTLGALVGVPLAKIVMDAFYPVIISNVAFGPDMTLLPWLYAAIFGLIFVSYFSISLLLNKRLKCVTPAEVLKRRE